MHTDLVAFTLTMDCGGGGIKGSVLDDAGTMRAHPMRVPTPYPLHPDLFVKTLVELGTKDVLTAMLRRIDKEAVGVALNSAEAVAGTIG